jgi:hypothetical protein
MSARILLERINSSASFTVKYEPAVMARVFLKSTIKLEAGESSSYASERGSGLARLQLSDRFLTTNLLCEFFMAVSCLFEFEKVFNQEDFEWSLAAGKRNDLDLLWILKPLPNWVTRPQITIHTLGERLNSQQVGDSLELAYDSIRSAEMGGRV